jgi:tetratricopeptide (TPR) repeat protein
LAHSRRIAGDLFGAEQAFRRAEEQLRRGTRDHLERAHVLVLKAVLRRAQRRFFEAERLLRRALSIWLSAGESKRAIEAMLSWSIVHAEHGEPERAIRLLREASELPAALSDPHLALAIHHNLAMFLIQAEKFLEAEGVLLHIRGLYEQLTGAELRQQWVLGLLARGRGRMDEAEALFVELQSIFLKQGLVYDAAQVNLELALVFLETGRTAEAGNLAHEALAVFVGLRVEREALAAFLLTRWTEAPPPPA